MYLVLVFFVALFTYILTSMKANPSSRVMGFLFSFSFFLTEYDCFFFPTWMRLFWSCYYTTIQVYIIASQSWPGLQNKKQSFDHKQESFQSNTNISEWISWVKFFHYSVHACAYLLLLNEGLHLLFTNLWTELHNNNGISTANILDVFPFHLLSVQQNFFISNTRSTIAMWVDPNNFIVLLINVPYRFDKGKIVFFL